jgi:HAD superfamily hydrolase (TIGR01490 family)
VRAAIFDVDRTLLPGTTGEMLFAWRLLRAGQIRWPQLMAAARLALRRPWPGAILATWRAERPYLYGKDAGSVALLAQECFEHDICPRLSRKGLDRVRDLVARGDHTVLLSGSLVSLVEPLRALTGADQVVASHLRASSDGHIIGIDGVHAYGQTKADLVRTLARELSLCLEESYCYADHHTDEQMLSLFGHPVCVNPRPRMRAIAERRGWPIEEFS